MQTTIQTAIQAEKTTLAFVCFRAGLVAGVDRHFCLCTCAASGTGGTT